ncbi:xanthine dehydrogenase family protein molybdopterin-binding subunit [Citreimonas sp.]|uniref:xanthine dehydrogenase family protein molybdopterin-binding subunit n=1 Tax=Citreimonas sp. TaxID=3036715 RepID=UPI00405A05DF
MDQPERGRREDVRLLTGQGRYTGDLFPEDALHAVFLRAPVARGRFAAPDVSDAAGLPGIVAIYTAADLKADGLTDLPLDVEPVRDDGGAPQPAPRPLLNDGVIRHLAEPVAMIVATSRESAEDAAEAILIAYDDDGVPVLDTRAATQDPVWDGAADNTASFHVVGDSDAVAAAMDSAAHVAEVDLDISRLAATSLEPRVCLGMIRDGRMELTTSTQSPFAIRGSLATLFRRDAESIRVIAPDVGGSFGMKGGLYREEALVLWAAEKLGRPVGWRATRSEAFLADDHGRSVKANARLALDGDGRFTALQVAVDVDVGAYFGRRSKGMLNNLGGIAGTYRIGAIAGHVRFAFTNAVPTCPYRGFGRPEATYIIESLIDRAARDTGRDRFALRRANLIPPEAMPYRTALTYHYDCGDFPRVFDRAMTLAEADGFEARRSDSAARGRLRGLGIAMPIEVAGGPLRQLKRDVARITIGAAGRVSVAPGCMSVGQGHETALSRMVADRLGIAVDSVDFRQGDTDLLPEGRGNGGSAATAVGAAAVSRAADEIVRQARAIAAQDFDAAPDDVELREGMLTLRGTNRAMSLAEAAVRAEGGLSALAEFLPEGVTYPNGCHLCEVEIDPETGHTTILRYTAVEDVGTVLNPQMVEGQMTGGIAQGLGQTMGEVIAFDAYGQILTGSFMDYPMPRARDMPELRLDTVEVPTQVNPLGAKGVGEAGTVGALAASISAVRDALAQAGVSDFEMPATPDRVWQALSGRSGI